jgi:glycosyltransferase involved in cell wall biosynthesis
MKPLISVVVPVYNTGKYLGRCLDSILAQTYQNFEVILVDDASSDNSYEVYTQYIQRDSRIRILKKEQNEGLSAARNSGIEICRGQYLAFMDSDDWVDAKMLEIMLKAMQENQSDMAMCGYQCVKSDGSIQRHVVLPDAAVMDQEEVWRLVCREQLDCHAWAKMYRRELFETVRFPEGKWYEDIFVFPKIVDQCTRISSLPDELVMYRIHEAAFTKRPYEIGRMDIVESYLYLYAYASGKNLDFLMEKASQWCYCRLIEAVKECRFTTEEQKKLKLLFEKILSVCGFHPKFAPMVAVYFGMRKLHLPIKKG